MEFKGQRHRCRTEIDSLDLDVDSAVGPMSCGFPMSLLSNCLKQREGKQSSLGAETSGPGIAPLGESRDPIRASMLLTLVNTH